MSIPYTKSDKLGSAFVLSTDEEKEIRSIPIVLFKYAECTNREDMLEVNPDYTTDLTSTGSWVYYLPSLSDGSTVFTEMTLDETSVKTIADTVPAWDDGDAHNIFLRIRNGILDTCVVRNAVNRLEDNGWTVTVEELSPED